MRAALLQHRGMDQMPAADARPSLPAAPGFHFTPARLVDLAGRKLIDAFHAVHGLVAFLLITLGVTVMKFNRARSVIHPMIRAHIAKAGIGIFPMVSFLAVALGLVIVGQTVFLLTRFGAENYIGTVMDTVVVRELGPMLAALLVLARSGTANVVELGTARAQNEVEALEALVIDPIHYLVVPRVIALALSVFALTVYLIVIALMSGYLFAFLEDVPLTPAAYVQQLAGGLIWQDFVLLALKTVCFGILIAVVTSYEGLAQPLRLEEVSGATNRAVAKCVVAIVLLDAIFIVIYLVI
jgi:phospholipid/cholesterol/gamma-HCH transport system permease protein